MVAMHKGGGDKVCFKCTLPHPSPPVQLLAPSPFSCELTVVLGPPLHSYFLHSCSIWIAIIIRQGSVKRMNRAKKKFKTVLKKNNTVKRGKVFKSWRDFKSLSV